MIIKEIVKCAACNTSFYDIHGGFLCPRCGELIKELKEEVATLRVEKGRLTEALVLVTEALALDGAKALAQEAIEKTADEAF